MYRIIKMRSEDYDNLPYKGARGSLGLADQSTMTAYVRDTGIEALDEGTMQHELQELLAEVSPHEEDGIRYKKGGAWRQILPMALAFVPGIGPILSTAAYTGMNQYAKSNHPEQLGKPGGWGLVQDIGMGALQGFGANKLGQGFAQGWKAAGQNGTSQLIGGLKGSVGIAPSGAAKTNLSSAVSSGANTITPSSIGPTAEIGSNFGKGISSLSPSATGGAGVSNLSTLSGAAKDMVSQYATAASPAAPALAGNSYPAINAAGSTVKSAVKSNLSDSAMNLFSSSGPKQPMSVPQISGSQGALDRWTGDLAVNKANAPIDPNAWASIESGIESNAATQRKNIFEQFRQISPGATIEGNTAFARSLGNVEKSMAAEKDAAYNELQTNNNIKSMYSQVKTNNRLTDDQMKSFVNLALNGTDDDIRYMVANDPVEFRSFFKQFKGLV